VRRYRAAMAASPTLYLLTGLPCSGKTTYAKDLEERGVVRVSVDESMVEKLGRLGVDYDRSDHIALLEPLLMDAHQRIRELLSAGHDVVFDHGLGRRNERDAMKQLATTCGARWELLVFDADLSTLHARCEQRSRVPGTVPITAEILDVLAMTWERPDGEGETVIVTD